MKNTTIIIIQLAIITYFLISISSKVDIGNEAQQQQVAIQKNSQPITTHQYQELNKLVTEHPNFSKNYNEILASKKLMLTDYESIKNSINEQTKAKQQAAEKAKQAQEDERFKKEHPTLSALINILTSYYMIIILGIIIFFGFFRMVFKD